MTRTRRFGPASIRWKHLRVAYLAAGAHYDAAVRAADIAADFAYFKAAAQNTGYGG